MNQLINPSPTPTGSPPSLASLLASGELCKSCYRAKFQKHEECDQGMCDEAYRTYLEENGWEN